MARKAPAPKRSKSYRLRPPGRAGLIGGRRGDGQAIAIGITVISQDIDIDGLPLSDGSRIVFSIRSGVLLYVQNLDVKHLGVGIACGILDLDFDVIDVVCRNHGSGVFKIRSLLKKELPTARIN